jgi:hypothetical protein
MNDVERSGDNLVAAPLSSTHQRSNRISAGC